MKLFDNLGDLAGWIWNNTQSRAQLRLLPAWALLAPRKYTRNQFLDMLLRKVKVEGGGGQAAVAVGEEDQQQVVSVLFSEVIGKPQEPPEGVTVVFHEISIKGALHILRHGKFDIPGRFTYVDRPEPPSPLQSHVRLYFILPNYYLLGDLPVGTGRWLAANFIKDLMGAALPVELREAFTQEVRESSHETLAGVLLAIEEAGLLMRVETTQIDRMRTLPALEKGLKRGTITQEQYIQLTTALNQIRSDREEDISDPRSASPLTFEDRDGSQVELKVSPLKGHSRFALRTVPKNSSSSPVEGRNLSQQALREELRTRIHTLRKLGIGKRTIARRAGIQRRTLDDFLERNKSQPQTLTKIQGAVEELEEEYKEQEALRKEQQTLREELRTRIHALRELGIGKRTIARKAKIERAILDSFLKGTKSTPQTLAKIQGAVESFEREYKEQEALRAQLRTRIHALRELGIGKRTIARRAGIQRRTLDDFLERNKSQPQTLTKIQGAVESLERECQEQPTPKLFLKELAGIIIILGTSSLRKIHNNNPLLSESFYRHKENWGFKDWQAVVEAAIYYELEKEVEWLSGLRVSINRILVAYSRNRISLEDRVREGRLREVIQGISTQVNGYKTTLNVMQRQAKVKDFKSLVAMLEELKVKVIELNRVVDNIDRENIVVMGLGLIKLGAVLNKIPQLSKDPSSRRANSSSPVDISPQSIMSSSPQHKLLSTIDYGLSTKKASSPAKIFSVETRLQGVDTHFAKRLGAMVGSRLISYSFFNSPMALPRRDDELFYETMGLKISRK